MFFDKKKIKNFEIISFEHLIVEIENNHLAITLNRANKKNALNSKMIEARGDDKVLLETEKLLKNNEKFIVEGLKNFSDFINLDYLKLNSPISIAKFKPSLLILPISCDHAPGAEPKSRIFKLFFIIWNF